jgi:hypothetical protein
MRGLQRAIAAVIAGLGAFALGACDNASEVRVIMPDSATSTCIGDPKTPECAVETMLACIVRADKRLCEIALRGPEGALCRTYFEPQNVCNFFPDGIEYDSLGLFFGDEVPWEKALYRFKRIETVPSTNIAPSLAYFPKVPDPQVLEISVDRWLCYDVDGAPSRAQEPNGTISNRLAGLARRLQTVMWEIGLSNERPSNWVWYKVGSDYCWYPLKYWVWQFRVHWIVVRWTREVEPNCESIYGCPEMKWPPYRKILDNPPS